MIFIYCIIALFISWIWVDYYRLIEVYKQVDLKRIAFVFTLGCLTSLFIIALNWSVLDKIPLHANGNLAHDFLYYFLFAGFLEELAKGLPILVLYYFKRDYFKEPIDYLAFFCISALGFSAVENVMYFKLYGPTIIEGRATLSTLTHMFCSAIFAYGLVRYVYQSKKDGKAGIIGFFFIAVLGHTLFDLGAFDGENNIILILIAIGVFFLLISIFAVIVNNSLNNSSLFTYKKVVDSDKVAMRILSYYGIIVVIQLIILSTTKSVNYAVYNMRMNILPIGLIATVAAARLGRFKLIRNKWEKIKLEMPFSIVYNERFYFNPGSYSFYHYNSGTLPFTLKVKGETYDEASVNQFYEDYAYLNPVSSHNVRIKTFTEIYMDEKLFLKDEAVFYRAKLFLDEKHERFEEVLLRPKTFDITTINDKYPIVAVFKIDSATDLSNTNLCVKDFNFIEWGYVKSIAQKELN